MSAIPYAVNVDAPANLLKGKVAIITGGSDGIGKATAVDFAKEGAKVVIFGRTKEKVDKVVKELNDKYGSDTAIGYAGDAAKEADNKAAVDLALKTYKKLDVAFNNAGIMGKLNLVHEIEEKSYDEVFNVNVKGVIFALKYQIPAMLETAGGKGSIIVNSSVNALRHFKLGSQTVAVYSASKAAVDSITKTAAIEQAGKIRINAINPAIVETSLHGGSWNPEQVSGAASILHLVPRTGRPEEIAPIVTFLASDKASFVTGANWVADAGSLLV